MTNLDWGQLISTVGFPIALVLGLGIAMWRSLVWLAPHIAEVVRAHIAFLQSIERSVTSLTEMSRSTCIAVETLTQRLDKFAEVAEQRDKNVEALLEKIASRPCLLPELAQRRHTPSMAIPETHK